MGNVIKSFLVILLASFGIGMSVKTSIGFPILGAMSFIAFCVFDFKTIFRMLCGSRSYLFGMSCLFVPMLVFLWVVLPWEFYDVGAQSCVFAAIGSFLVVVVSIPIWGAVFLCERIKKLYT